MSRRLINRLLVLSVGLLSGWGLSAQEGAYNGFTPYSVYGVGALQGPGTAYNAGMGGVGIATRNRRFVNILNPAAVTARDTLSFMMDFGLSGKASLFRQDQAGQSYTSGNNLFNISDFVISFPIWRTSAMMVGIKPFSNVGYNFSHTETDAARIAESGNLGYTAAGYGSLYEIFAAYGATLWRRLSVGAELFMYFGNLDRNTDLVFGNSTYRSIYNSYNLELHGTTAKFGLQYEQPFGGGLVMTLGATYRLKAPMRGHVSEAALGLLSTQTDTLRYRMVDVAGSDLRFGDELGVGISLRKGERWLMEVDYTRSDWTGCGLDDTRGFRVSSPSAFSAKTAQSVRAGFEITPNRNDIRYFYNRWTYRVGAYYDESYYRMNGRTVTAYGITLGLTVPVYMGHNGITLGLDIGQRGSLADSMVRERYLGFNVGVNIFDIWFRKPRYD